MRLSEIVSQIQLVLPKYTDYFSTTIPVTTIVATSTVATITSIAHGLLTNDAIAIVDVVQNNGIISVSQDGLVFTFELESSHDLTLGYPGYETVKLGGFSNQDWNGDFKLIATPSNTIFKVQSSNALPTLTGAEYITEKRIDGVNGRYAVTVIDADTITVSGNFKPGTYTLGAIKKTVRIAGSVTPERALEQYTKQKVNDLWMFVTMGDAVVSKNRNTLSDATATIGSGEDIRTRVVDNFSLFIVKNVTNEYAATEALDIARHELFGPISKTLFGAKFSTGLSVDPGSFRVIMTGHNYVEYNKSTLVYQYNFEFTVDMTDLDTVEANDTKAFSDISLTHDIGTTDTDDMTVGIELID